MSDRLHFEKRDGYMLAVDPAAPCWMATNEDGAWALRELRAGRSRDEISYRYAKRVGISLARALELVTPFSDEVSSFASPGRRSPYQGRAHYLQPDRLKEVWLHVTDRCNLACRHCLVSSGPAGREGISTEHLRSFIQQACDLGAETFHFTGGEPLLRSDLPGVLRSVASDYRATAVVLTNGTLLDEELALKLSELPQERLHLQVSLDGSSPERNDALRSRGSFHSAVQGIRNAVSAGLNVTVATVVVKKNLDDLIPIARLIRGLGVKQLHLMWQHVRERGARLRRPSMRQMHLALRALMAEADDIGLVIDNIENLRRTVNGDPNVKYDLSNACWDSLAIYRDGRVFPSACLVGIDSEVGGSLFDRPLRDIWLDCERFDRHRASSVVDLPVNGDPFLFLHGGGDPEQAFFAADGNGLAPVDPYLPLHRMMCRAVMDAMVAERKRLIGPPSPGPTVFHMMGEDGYGCPIEAGAKNGGEHIVDFVHSNCVLIQDVIAKTRAQVQRYYGEAAREIKTEICSPMAFDPRYLTHIPEEVVARSYGCGSPVFAAELQAGETVVDLGSGAGLECFIASRLVGKKGKVMGVDMTAAMVAFADRARARVAERLGYDNMQFERGQLEQAPLGDNQADAVISNCVINLSPEKLRVLAEVRRVLKPGGRVVISDLVSERPLPAKIRFNPRLRGECIAGALTEAKLLQMLRKLGFAHIEVLSRTPWRTVEGIAFDSVTVRAWKPPREELRNRAPTSSMPGGHTGFPSTFAARSSTDLLPSVGGKKRMVDCMVCGAPLVYLEEQPRLPCHYCLRTTTADCRCQEGHFVCDQCHTGNHLEFIKSFCSRTSETDPIALFFAMRRSSLFPVHGPEHHTLAPAAFLTAYRNAFGEPSEERIEGALDRAAAQLPGGTCAFWGGCAAALGIGVAYSAILGATPLRGEPRGIVQMVVSRLLAEIGKLGAARCCRRESYLALKLGCELSREYLPRELKAGPLPECDQIKLNRECLGKECPLHPEGASGALMGDHGKPANVKVVPEADPPWRAEAGKET